MNCEGKTLLKTSILMIDDGNDNEEEEEEEEDDNDNFHADYMVNLSIIMTWLHGFWARNCSSCPWWQDV